VANCSPPGRRRLNNELVVAVVMALHPDPGYVTQWRQALRVIGGETEAVSQVRVHASLPPELAGFTGRGGELDELRRAGRAGDAVVISAIEGMAGVGKTQLAVHAGHRLLRENTVDRVLFVNLRGFHPDPAQPPADPAAVLEGFLRLLGVPGHQIPHGIEARTESYRQLLDGVRALVVLDNAAGAEQVRPLLPQTPDCAALVTSRRSLTELRPATHLTVDVFTAGETQQFLTRAAPHVSVGDDPNAAGRIARRCGRLPLALGLVAGHMRAKAGWTLTDHADWLDERHRDRRLDTGIELALDLSYQHLPADRQRLLRLLALHPGSDLDAYAAAALADTDVDTARAHLRHLRGDHLLQQSTPNRYTFHDLVRAYATTRAHDEDRPADRRTALTRLFDHYLATAAAAMDRLHPAEAHRRPKVPPAATPMPDLTEPGAWLDSERHTLVAVAAHTAAHGWPAHTTRLARTLFRYLDGGHFTDAATVHEHAHRAARDLPEEAHALTDLGATDVRLGRYEQAGDHFRRALDLFRRTGDLVGQARAVSNLGAAEHMSDHYRRAVEHYAEALDLHRQTGSRTGEARALDNLGQVETLLGQYASAGSYCLRALALQREAGDRNGEAHTLNNLADIELRTGRYDAAREYLEQALVLYRQLGNRNGEAWTLDLVGSMHTRLGRPDEAAGHHEQAMRIFSDHTDRDGESWALNGLGEAASAGGRAAEAVTHHAAALGIAAEIGQRRQQARALTGLGHANRALGDVERAREHFEQALDVYAELELPEAEQVRGFLA
jgi:tetratricopeptide (TPR) repeat protein